MGRPGLNLPLVWIVVTKWWAAQGSYVCWGTESWTPVPGGGDMHVSLHSSILRGICIPVAVHREESL